MSIWESSDWKEYYLDKPHRSGVRLRFDSKVDIDVRNAIKRMVSWLRKRYEFPMRIHVYIKGSSLIRARDGDMVYDLFFWPNCRDVEPHIKIATGDYYNLTKEIGKDDAIATILLALLIELTHYFQWLNGKEFSYTTLNRQASRTGRKVLETYAETL